MPRIALEFGIKETVNIILDASHDRQCYKEREGRGLEF
jgi:hypothetical protein